MRWNCIFWGSIFLLLYFALSSACTIPTSENAVQTIEVDKNCIPTAIQEYTRVNNLTTQNFLCYYDLLQNGTIIEDNKDLNYGSVFGRLEKTWNIGLSIGYYDFVIDCNNTTDGNYNFNFPRTFTVIDANVLSYQDSNIINTLANKISDSNAEIVRKIIDLNAGLLAYLRDINAFAKDANLYAYSSYLLALDINDWTTSWDNNALYLNASAVGELLLNDTATIILAVSDRNRKPLAPTALSATISFENGATVANFPDLTAFTNSAPGVYVAVWNIKEAQKRGVYTVRARAYNGDTSTIAVTTLRIYSQGPYSLLIFAIDENVSDSVGFEYYVKNKSASDQVVKVNYWIEQENVKCCQGYDEVFLKDKSSLQAEKKLMHRLKIDDLKNGTAFLFLQVVYEKNPLESEMVFKSFSILKQEFQDDAKNLFFAPLTTIKWQDKAYEIGLGMFFLIFILGSIVIWKWKKG